MRIIGEDRMLAVWEGFASNGVSLTRSFAMAETFSVRAHDNAVQHAYGAKPRDEEMLPWVAERNVNGNEGAVIVFDRRALEHAFTSERLFQVESDTEDEQEERLLHDSDFLDHVVQHITRIVIIDPQRYHTFKRFVLHYHGTWAATFARIERLT